MIECVIYIYIDAKAALALRAHVGRTTMSGRMSWKPRVGEGSDVEGSDAELVGEGLLAVCDAGGRNRCKVWPSRLRRGRPRVLILVCGRLLVTSARALAS